MTEKRRTFASAEERRARKRETCRAWRRLKYATDAEWREREQARIAGLVAERGGNPEPGPSGWPIGYVPPLVRRRRSKGGR